MNDSSASAERVRFFVLSFSTLFPKNTPKDDPQQTDSLSDKHLHGISGSKSHLLARLPIGILHRAFITFGDYLRVSSSI